MMPMGGEWMGGRCLRGDIMVEAVGVTWWGLLGHGWVDEMEEKGDKVKCSCRLD